jgi:hypothetical protein
VGLERGSLSLVSTTEEILERKSRGSGLENGHYGCRDPSRSPRRTLYPQKLVLALPTSGDRSIGIVRPGTQATEFIIANQIVTQFPIRREKGGLWCNREHKPIGVYSDVFQHSLQCQGNIRLTLSLTEVQIVATRIAQHSSHKALRENIS